MKNREKEKDKKGKSKRMKSTGGDNLLVFVSIRVVYLTNEQVLPGKMCCCSIKEGEVAKKEEQRTRKDIRSEQ